MESRRVGALAGIVSVLGVLVQFVPQILLERWVDGGLEGAIPTVGTAGQTVTLYSLLVETVGPVVTLALAVGLGYYASQRFDVAHEHRRFGGAVAGGSLVGVAAIWAARLAAGQFGSTTASLVLLNLAVLVGLVLRISLVVTVGAFAGAALSQFRTTPDSPAGSTDADAGGPSPVTGESATDDPDASSSTA